MAHTHIYIYIYKKNKKKDVHLKENCDNLDNIYNNPKTYAHILKR